MACAGGMEVATSRGALRLLRTFFGILLLFLYLPIAILALFSFNDGDVTFPLQGFTIAWYERIVDNPHLIASLQRSAIVAFVSSTIAVALGVLTSFALLRRRFVGKTAASALFFSPLVVPYLERDREAFEQRHDREDRVRQRNDHVADHHRVQPQPDVDAEGVGEDLVHEREQHEQRDPEHEEAAQDLGAGPWDRFRRVTLPLLTPALFSSFLIAFTLSFDEYAIASFLAGTQATWPVYLYAQLRVPSQLPQVVAVSSVILVASLLLVLAAEITRRVSARRYGKQFAARGLA